MPAEPLSPELALVDPELGARAAPPSRIPRTRTPRSREPTSAAAPALPRLPAQRRAAARSGPAHDSRLWLLVVGMLIGGTAIPHAQDRPRVVPPAEDVTICEPGPAPRLRPAAPGLGDPLSRRIRRRAALQSPCPGL